MTTQLNANAPFHIALPCKDLKVTKDFYLNKLNAALGRNSENWIDVNLFGNQLTFTTAGEFNFKYRNYKFGEEVLPSFHFGVILSLEKWEQLKEHLIKEEVEFFVDATFLPNKVGEHFSFIVTDPNGYMVEFKNFKNNIEIFEV